MKLLEGGEVLRAGKTVVAVLDEGELDVWGDEAFGDAERGFPGDIRVLLAVEEADVALDRDGGVQEEVGAAFLDEVKGHGGGVAVLAGNVQDTFGQEAGAFGGHEGVPDEGFGEVGGGGDADEGGGAGGPGQGNEEGDPAAHAGADQHEGAVGEAVDDVKGVLGPGADGAVFKFAVAGPMARVVEAEAGRAEGAARGFDGEGLGAGHVAAEAGKEDGGGGAAGEVGVGEVDAVATVEAAFGDLVHGMACFVARAIARTWRLSHQTLRFCRCCPGWRRAGWNEGRLRWRRRSRWRAGGRWWRVPGGGWRGMWSGWVGCT